MTALFEKLQERAERAVAVETLRRIDALAVRDARRGTGSIHPVERIDSSVSSGRLGNGNTSRRAGRDRRSTSGRSAGGRHPRAYYR